jgi:hypothetical protein
MKKSEPPNWGSARIAVISLREEIARALAAGWPVARIYRENEAKLGNLTMGAFQRQVRQIVKNPLPFSPAPTGPNDGHKSATGTFTHNPQIRQDDRQQLLGVGDDRRK